jgi:hypothetical protein
VAGAVKDWAIEEVLLGLAEPTIAAYVPECGPDVVTEVVPAVVQPVRFPVSKPPLVIDVAADAGVDQAAVPRRRRAADAATASSRFRSWRDERWRTFTPEVRDVWVPFGGSLRAAGEWARPFPLPIGGLPNLYFEP